MICPLIEPLEFDIFVISGTQRKPKALPSVKLNPKESGSFSASPTRLWTVKLCKPKKIQAEKLLLNTPKNFNSIGLTSWRLWGNSACYFNPVPLTDFIIIQVISIADELTDFELVDILCIGSFENTREVYVGHRWRWLWLNSINERSSTLNKIRRI